MFKLSPPTEKARRPEPEITIRAPSAHTLSIRTLSLTTARSHLRPNNSACCEPTSCFPPGGSRHQGPLLVTSALPGEGKSFVASNLALTIAQNIDKHVLLIDCDMRRPTVHRIFGYENLPGLSNYLLGDATLPELLIRTGNNHLSILPGGPAPSNPAELVSSNRMLALLREVRSRYDDRYIIIDSRRPT